MLKGITHRYFNTVGSKEGWTPSTFSSSRSNRKNGNQKSIQQRPEDFMDEEDIRDAEDAKRVETVAGFSGLGSTVDDVFRKEAPIDIFRVDGETIGVRLLKKMGWKEGQGIGPKVRRPARLGDDEKLYEAHGPTHLFAPKNVNMIGFLKKNDYKGIGFKGETKIQSQYNTMSSQATPDEEESEVSSSLDPSRQKKKNCTRSGMGVGILNDTGSDDEDPYDVGPRISYNRFIGGDKKKVKKKKPLNRVLNPLVVTKPVYLSKRIAQAKAAVVTLKCLDGSLPLDGFHLTNEDESSSIHILNTNYHPPEIPKGWKSSKKHDSYRANTKYLSTSDAARASRLDPRSRALALGESSLPGKSVFDYLSPAARDRLAAASGKDDLPVALGLIPTDYKMTKDERDVEISNQIPRIDKLTADAALKSGESGFMPYGDDEAKRKRYRDYLEYQSGIKKDPPFRESKVSDEDWLNELREFSRCAQIFKPMSGLMATRFTHSTNASQLATSNPVNETKVYLFKNDPKPEDPAEQAARLSMYGPMTRSSKEWYPSRLLCKRFNINLPTHVQHNTSQQTDQNKSQNIAPELASKYSLDTMMPSSYPTQQHGASCEIESEVNDIFKKADARKLDDNIVVVNSEENEALEGQKAGEAVFRAIFGDDSEDE